MDSGFLLLSKRRSRISFLLRGFYTRRNFRSTLDNLVSLVIVILFTQTKMRDAVIINYFSRVTKRQKGNLVHTRDALGSRQVGDVWTLKPQTRDWGSTTRWLSHFNLLACFVVRKLYVLMGDRIVLKCFCFPLISLLNGEKY